MLQNLFNIDSNREDTKSLLLQTVKDHPYFAPAQFFLLKQIDKEDAMYKQQIAKTSVLFNNPLWLNFQLLHSNHNSNSSKINDVTELNTDNLEKPQTEEIEKQDNNLEAVSQIEVVGTNTSENLPGEEIPPITLPSLSDPVKEDSFTFEPLYTTDYFASQGIKLSEEIKPDDKLGKQLKSFTEWLKTMKKVHVAEPMETDANVDVSIQKLAEQSNTENVILTEAMADVLIQQGKVNKAIEVYQKLSLLNPSKSAYFAAKIEQFKV